MKNRILLFSLFVLSGLACSLPTGAALMATRQAKTQTPAAIRTNPIPDPTPTPQVSASATALPVCKVTAARYLFVRRGPGRDTGAIGYVEAGERLPLLEPGAEWHKVRTPAGIGYVSSYFCEVTR